MDETKSSVQHDVGDLVEVMWQGELVEGTVTGYFRYPQTHQCLAGLIDYSIALASGALFWSPAMRINP